MSTAVQSLTGRMAIEDLRRERVYIDLTPKQKLMVETFIQSEDRTTAVQTAYDVKSAEVARVISYEFFASPRVVACLAAYFQDVKD